MYFQYTKFWKGYNSYKHLRLLTTLKVDMKDIKTKGYAQFQLNMSMHVAEKCRKLYISSILSSETGLTPT